MGRISLGLALLTGLLTLVTALVIRAELAWPGLALFTPEGDGYRSVVLLHGSAGYAFVAAVIALAGFVAAPGWPIARLLGWLGLLALLPLLVLAVFAGAGLAGLQPPLAVGAGLTPTAPPGPAQRIAAAMAGPDAPGPAMARDPLYLPFAALAGLQLAALALTSARTGRHRTGLVCSALVLLCAAGIAVQLAVPYPTLVLPLVMIGCLALLAPLAIELSDSDGPSAPYLVTGTVLGLVLCIALAIIQSGWPRPWGPGGTMGEVASLHILTLMTPFLLAACLHARRAVPLAGGQLWIGALAVAAATAYAYQPYILLGRLGMPRLLADAPGPFAPLNLQASVGGLILVLAILAVTLRLLRRPRPRAEQGR